MKGLWCTHYSRMVLQLSKRTPKKNACLFCGGKYQKLAHHLECVHHKEADVARVLIFRKGTTERQLGFQQLANRGNFYHNCELYQAGEEDRLILKYKQRSKKTDEKGERNNKTDEEGERNKSTEDKGERNNTEDKAVGSKQTEQKGDMKYVPCPTCKALYAKATLWKHCKHCSKATSKPAKGQHVREGRLLLPSLVSSKTLHERVIAYMRQDEITAAVCSDRTIQDYRQRLLDKLGTDHKNYISRKMRELGKFVINMRECLDKDKLVLNDILHITNYETVLDVCKNLAGFSSSENSYSKPSVATSQKMKLSEKWMMKAEEKCRILKNL